MAHRIRTVKTNCNNKSTQLTRKCRANVRTRNKKKNNPIKNNQTRRQRGQHGGGGEGSFSIFIGQKANLRHTAADKQTTGGLAVQRGDGKWLLNCPVSTIQKTSAECGQLIAKMIRLKIKPEIVKTGLIISDDDFKKLFINEDAPLRNAYPSLLKIYRGEKPVEEVESAEADSEVESVESATAVAEPVVPVEAEPVAPVEAEPVEEEPEIIRNLPSGASMELTDFSPPSDEAVGPALEDAATLEDAAALQKKADEDALKKKADEDALQKKADEAAAALKKADEDALKKKADEDALQKKADEDALQKKADEDAVAALMRQQQETAAAATASAAPAAPATDKIKIIPANRDDAILKMIGFIMVQANTYLNFSRYDPTIVSFSYWSAPTASQPSKSLTRAYRNDELFSILGYETPPTESRGNAANTIGSFFGSVHAQIEVIRRHVQFARGANETYDKTNTIPFNRPKTTINARYNRDILLFGEQWKQNPKFDDQRKVATSIAMDIWSKMNKSAEVVEMTGFFMKNLEPKKDWFDPLVAYFEPLVPVFKNVFETAKLLPALPKTVATGGITQPVAQTTAPPPKAEAPPAQPVAAQPTGAAPVAATPVATQTQTKAPAKLPTAPPKQSPTQAEISRLEQEIMDIQRKLNASETYVKTFISKNGKQAASADQGVIKELKLIKQYKPVIAQINDRIKILKDQEGIAAALAAATGKLQPAKAPPSVAASGAAPVATGGIAAPITAQQEMLNSLKNPNTFVDNWVNANKITLLPTPIYVRDRRNLNVFPTVFHDWTVINTIGDGNCLTHAFLQCLSTIYGKIPPTPTGGYTYKQEVARAFRLTFSEYSAFARDKVLYNANGGLRDLSEQEITDYSRLFNVITVVFEQNSQMHEGKLVSQTLITPFNLNKETPSTATVIFIHGDNAHYSSVLPNTRRFSMTLEDARKIPELTNTLKF